MSTPPTTTPPPTEKDTPMPKSYHPDVPYYEHNPALPALEVRKGDVISYRANQGDTIIEHFGIVTEASHVLGGVLLQFDGHQRRDYALHHTDTVELHGYVSPEALTRLFQSQRNDEPLV